jgi:hypothetical protein
MKPLPERFPGEKPGSTDPPAERWKGGPRLSPGQRLPHHIPGPSCFLLGAERQSNLDARLDDRKHPCVDEATARILRAALAQTARRRGTDRLIRIVVEG